MGSADRTARTDAELALAWRTGDASAFDEVYRRHAPTLFGTAVGLVRDRGGASDVVHDTFVRAATRIESLRDPSRLRPWLFAILRNEAITWHRARGRFAIGLDDGPVPLSERLPDDADGPDVEISKRELADLVWTAAAGLQPRDREVLELHLRGGLEAGDLALVMGVTSGHAAVLLSRMRDRLELSLGAVLIARLGRSDCAALDRLLADWDGRFSLAVRGTVTRHVEGCRTCGRRRTALVSMEQLMPAVVAPVALLPEDLRLRLIAAFDAHDPRGPVTLLPADAWAWREDGFPWPVEGPEMMSMLSDGPADDRRSTGLLLGAGVLTLIIAIALGVRALIIDPATTTVDDTSVPSSVAAYPDAAARGGISSGGGLDAPLRIGSSESGTPVASSSAPRTATYPLSPRTAREGRTSSTPRRTALTKPPTKKPTPSKSPTPTKKPSPSKSPTPTKTPTPTKAPSPTPTRTPTPTTATPTTTRPPDPTTTTTTPTRPPDPTTTTTPPPPDPTTTTTTRPPDPTVTTTTKTPTTTTTTRTQTVTITTEPTTTTPSNGPN